MKFLEKYIDLKVFDFAIVWFNFVFWVLFIPNLQDTSILSTTLFAAFVFMFLPAIYLNFRSHKNLKEILIASLILGLLLGFSIEFIAEVNNVWNVNQLLVPFKIFAKVPIDNTIGHFCMTFFIFSFYEHFIDGEVSIKLSNSYKIPLYLGIFSMIAIVSLYAYNPEFVQFRYLYILIAVIFAVLFSFFIIYEHPTLFKKLLLLVGFFGFYFFIIELTALPLGFWSFPGDYFAMLNIEGVKFTLEELIFWIILYPPIIVSYYEYFVDDRR